MTEENKIAWKRISIEAAAIVLSILLAFAIDAWWDDMQRSADETESLELIKRDLDASIEALEHYQQFSFRTARSALDVYAALSGPGPYDHHKIHHQLLQIDRLTMKIPTAAYSDLINTGNLRIIEDRELRDAIVSFYEAQERAELIVLSNNTEFLDRQMSRTYFADGLVYPHFQIQHDEPNFDSINRRMNQLLGDEFVHLDDPLWKFAPDSREWDKLRAVVLSAAVHHVTGENIAKTRVVEAENLLQLIDEWQNR